MRRFSLHHYVAAGLAVAALALAGCGGGDDDDGGAATTGTAAQENVSGTVSMIGVWTGEEQSKFQAVLDGFTEQNPDVTVRYTAAGDNLPTVLSTAVEGGNPPDIATIAQPGLIADFQEQGEVQPLDFASDTIRENFSQDIVDLATIDGKLYSFVFKAANKSTVWYNVAAFEAAGVEPPTTWDELGQAADTIKASGTPPYSIAGADGWTLTDIFENIYLRQAGPEKYDQLSEHQIKWTDPTVTTALTTMAEVLQSDDIYGGTSGALQTDFPTAVSNVFTDPAKAAMIIEGDFVPGVVPNNTLEPETGYNVFAFPSIDDSPSTVVGGGDSITLFKSTPASRALVEYLATPEAAQIWAEKGGFSSANTKLSADVYPDEITRTTATAIAEADVFRFDMSDLAPAAFGGTPGQGEWKILQDFLANPDSVNATAAKLEAAAARAYR